MDLFIDRTWLSKYLFGKEVNPLDLSIIAPEDAFKNPVPFDKTAGLIHQLIEQHADIELIFFEANLGEPGSLVANKVALACLIEAYPEAFFVLKGNTPAAIEDAERFLMKEKNIPQEKVINLEGQQHCNEQLELALQHLIHKIIDTNQPRF